LKVIVTVSFALNRASSMDCTVLKPGDEDERASYDVRWRATGDVRVDMDSADGVQTLWISNETVSIAGLGSGPGSDNIRSMSLNTITPESVWRPAMEFMSPEILAQNMEGHYGLMQSSGRSGAGQSEFLIAGREGSQDVEVTVDAKTYLLKVLRKYSLDSGDRKVLVKDGWGAEYLPTGHIVYFNTYNLFAVPFDPDTLEVIGGSVPILEGIQGAAFSDSGALVYVSQPTGTSGGAGTALSGRTLVWVDRQGREETLGASPDAYEDLRISPDGTRVALTIAGGNRDIWIWDITHKTPTKLTFDNANNQAPLWTPDGKRIVFNSMRDRGFLGGLYWQSADSIGEAELLVSKPGLVDCNS
jgi:hypothetical protein